MRTAVAIRSLLFSFVLLALSHASFGQVGIGISVGFGPPPIPIYEQPICPADGWLWTPGYWDWGGSAFLWHVGYWGPHVGFYGGINYGFGYGGVGFEGGRWQGGHLFYNRSVVNVGTTNITNVYNKTVVNNVTINHV